ncbi:MAG: FHA domain-containing protein [Micrococcales bacterium]|nr:FHA domain-containing protein [Micrococcales bacterium]MCL2666817.1 FHA domain-containing protein [Micrococcales bacterium]
MELPDYRTSEPDTTINYAGIEPAESDGLPPVRLSADEAAAVQALPPTSALLILHHGPSAGARFLLDGDATVAGRSTSSDIFLDDVTVSRRHAEFVREDTSFTVSDVGSLNGTYVNRERIEKQHLLRGGDEVQIGKFRMTFHPSPAREATG